MMKKFLGLALLAVSAAAFAPSVEAKSVNTVDLTTAVAANSAVVPQYQRRYNQRRARVVVQTRNVRRGRNLYREIYRTTYRPNGRVVTQLVSRTIIRRY